MLIRTASEGISFAKSLEIAAASFYETMAADFDGLRAFALASAAENRQNARQIQRVYQEVITDAIETGYCFRLETAGYELKNTDAELREEKDAVGAAIVIEGRMLDFYAAAHEQTDKLMADIPRAFSGIRKKHERRLRDLEAFVHPGGVQCGI